MIELGLIWVYLKVELIGFTSVLDVSNCTNSGTIY